jgi:hypothetical protein
MAIGVHRLRSNSALVVAAALTVLHQQQHCLALAHSTGQAPRGSLNNVDGSTAAFDGQWISGVGDATFLGLLDVAARQHSTTETELQSVVQLYRGDWDGLMEGTGWGAWWTQNSFGPTYVRAFLLSHGLHLHLHQVPALNSWITSTPPCCVPSSQSLRSDDDQAS